MVVLVVLAVLVVCRMVAIVVSVEGQGAEVVNTGLNGPMAAVLSGTARERGV